MQLSKIDLSSFHDFPPQPSAHTALCLSLNAKGELSMNTALRRAMGETRDFHAQRPLFQVRRHIEKPGVG